MTPDADATTVRSFYASFDERPYEESVAQYLHDDVMWHVAGSNPLAGTFRGAPAVLAAMRAYADGSAGTLRLDTQTVLAGAGHVVAIHEATAALPGLDYQAHEVDIFHLREGRITEFWSFSEDQEATDTLWSVNPDVAKTGR